MIKIELRDGRILDNDPACGFNLLRVDEIVEVLNNCAFYALTTDATGYHAERLIRSQVVRVYDDVTGEEMRPKEDGV